MYYYHNDYFISYLKVPLVSFNGAEGEPDVNRLLANAHIQYTLHVSTNSHICTVHYQVIQQSRRLSSFSIVAMP